MQSFIILNVDMQSVIILNVNMLNVKAPKEQKQTNRVDSIIDLLLKHRVINDDYHLSRS